MTWLQRRVGILILFALLFSISMVYAQDPSTVTVVGSGIVAPPFEQMTAASGAPITLETSVTGTNNGFQTFCQGAADITLANRTISSDENSACAANSIEYVEQLVAHQIIAFIGGADAAFATCFTTNHLNAMFAPSAQDSITNWNQVDAANGDIPLVVIVPQNITPSFVILDNIVQGDGVRADAATEENDEAIIAGVAANPGAIGVVNYQSALAAGDEIKILQLNINEAVGCVSPSATSIEDRTYTAAESHYVYVIRASLEKPGLMDAFRFISSDEAASSLTGLGLTAPTPIIYATNLASLEGTGEAAPFSAGDTAFQIPLDVSGNVAVAGATVGYDYLSLLATRFQSVYTTVTIEVNTEGQPGGIRRLCNGEIDIAVIDKELTDEQTQNCAANNINTLSIELGNQAVVVIGNSTSPYQACLSAEQLATIWRAPADPNTSITSWNQLGSDFPDQGMTLFQPGLGNAASDLLLTEATGNVLPARNDTEFDNDPLYRAAAVANVEGALTYMTWAEYQQVLANNQERIQLVGVTGESDCVIPTEDTIANGTYPLTQSATLLVNRASLVKPQVQSFLWYLASDENYPSLAESGFTGVTFGSFITLRETLQKAFADASNITPESTLEAGIESTTEATREVTPEAIADVTAEATSEATDDIAETAPTVEPEATPDAPAETTAEATPSS